MRVRSHAARDALDAGAQPPATARVTATSEAARAISRWGLFRELAVSRHELLATYDALIRQASGLSLAQFRLLSHVSAADRPLRVWELADALLVTPGAVSHMLNRLCAMGLATRTLSAMDARGDDIHATADGSRLVALGREATNRWGEQHGSALLPPEQFDRLAAIIGQLPGGDAQPAVDAARPRVQRILFRFLEVAGRCIRDVEAGLSEQGMSLGRATVLASLAEAQQQNEPRRGRDLAREMGISTAAVTQMLNRMERDGLIVRERPACRASAVGIRLVGDGRRAGVAAAQARAALPHSRFISQLGDSDVEELLSLVRELHGNLRSGAIRAARAGSVRARAARAGEPDPT